MKRSILLASAAVAIVMSPQCAWAQSVSPPSSSASGASDADDESLSDIVVTAERRQANLQDVPIAVSAVTGDSLRESGARDVRDLAQLVPNIQFNQSNAGAQTNIFIRGVGISDTNATTTGAVGVYIDDVFIVANAGKVSNVFDTAGVEVLRGPQGTLYGRNTTGGAIKFASKLPTEEFSGDLDARYGNFNGVRIEGGLGGAIAPGLLKARISGVFQSRDGTILNAFTGDKVNNIKLWGVRGIFDFTPAPDFLARLTVNASRSYSSARQFVHRGQGINFDGSPNIAPDGTPLDGLGYANLSGDIDVGSYNVQGREIIETFGTSLKLDKQFDWGAITSISSYQQVKRDTVEDTDASPNDLLVVYAREKPKSFTQELRVQSRDDSRLRWIVGGFYMHDKLKTNSAIDVLRALRNPAGPNNGADPANTIGFVRFPYVQTTESYALFGQADYQITDKLTGTLGLRYSHDKIAMDYRSFYEEPGPVIIADLARVDSAVSFEDLSYRAALNYKANDDVLVYGSYSKGYNAGGYPGGSAASNAELASYKPERLYAYEVGVKTELLDRKLRFNTSAFYYDYKDIQVFLLEFFGDGANQVPVQRKSNAEGAEVYGIETEVVARPAHGLELSISGSYTHSRYRQFVTSAGNYEGNQLVFTPKFSGTAAISYEYGLNDGGKLSARLEGYYSSRLFFFADNDRAYSQKAYANGNAYLTYTPKGGKLDLGLWMKNITDRRWLVTASKLITFDELAYSDPRTYGVRIGYHF